jgi:hypothetical protein
VYVSFESPARLDETLYCSALFASPAWTLHLHQAGHVVWRHAAGERVLSAFGSFSIQFILTVWQCMFRLNRRRKYVIAKRFDGRTLWIHLDLDFWTLGRLDFRQPVGWTGIFPFVWPIVCRKFRCPLSVHILFTIELKPVGASWTYILQYLTAFCCFNFSIRPDWRS